MSDVDRVIGLNRLQIVKGEKESYIRVGGTGNLLLELDDSPALVFVGHELVLLNVKHKLFIVLVGFGREKAKIVQVGLELVSAYEFIVCEVLLVAYSLEGGMTLLVLVHTEWVESEN